MNKDWLRQMLTVSRKIAAVAIFCTLLPACDNSPHSSSFDAQSEALAPMFDAYMLGQWSGLALNESILDLVLMPTTAHAPTLGSADVTLSQLSESRQIMSQVIDILRGDGRHLQESCTDDGGQLIDAAQRVSEVGAAIQDTVLRLQHTLVERLEAARLASKNPDQRLRNLGEDTARQVEQTTAMAMRLAVDIGVTVASAADLVEDMDSLPSACEVYRALVLSE